ncbi:MAG TPA: hypothetical protein PLS99_06475 [Thermotogota bacterium]|mgnify:FL=1|nr:hypothetical protein [Thermotogota bacterium]OQC31945.1 MAG: putative outer membrane protein PmpB precursor [Thermotogota bacterium ADurb.Bin062]HNW47042.1 hypothetical protein [Thermotogota bacterium]HOD91790.1 hypothetical protein [Thermotogota bacterium]HOS24877.1 hypothetical protein [Thermotogota bacterium]
MQDKRLSMIVLLLVTLIALAIITGCIARAVIAPPSIALIAPANGATGQATTLLLTWEATPGEAKNQKTPVTIIGYGLFFAPINEDYGVPEPRTDKQAQKTGLAYGATYKWKVAAVQSNGQTAESTERTFTTTNRLYGAPQIALTSPENGATNQATSVTLTWEATEGKQTNAGERDGANLTEYRVYHKKTGDPDPTEPATTTDKSYNLMNLDYAATYTWYVVVHQSDGQRATSTERSFSTQAAQYAAPEIALKSPRNGAEGQLTTVTLTWEATPGRPTNADERAPTIEEYLLYFGVRGHPYSNPATVTAAQQSKAGLDYGTTYKWKVVALQSDGQRATSDEWTFSTLAAQYDPPTIALTSPASGATDRPTTLTLTWEATPGKQTNAGERAVSLTYRVYHKKPGEEYPITPATTQEKFYILTNLSTGTEYTYKVEAVQSDGKSAETPEATFATRTGPVVRYDATGVYQRSYDKLSEAVAEAGNGDRIEVDGGTVLNNEAQQVTVSGTEVTIHSSDPGHPFTIDMSGKNDRVFNITNGASVTIRDAIVTGGAPASGDGGGIHITGNSAVTAINTRIASNTAKSGGGVYVMAGTFNATETSIISNRADWGGGVFVQNGFFNATESTVESNEAAFGGGIHITGNSTVRAINTTIASNTAYDGGGALVVDGIFNAIDTTITSNEATRYGGGAFVVAGTLNAEGTTISSNTADEGGGALVWDGIFAAKETILESNEAKSGGGVCVYENGFFNAVSTTIVSNTSADDGGGVCVEYGTFNATDTSIISNRAYLGGGVYIESGTFNATETSIISNRADWGGGVYAWSGNINTSNATISSNTAGEDGGGVLCGNSAFNAIDTTISLNTAGGGGGGVYAERGTFNATETSIISNRADLGGGVYAWNGNFNTANTTISSNTGEYGGGVALYGSSVFNAIDTTITSNEATRNGGGVYAYKGTINTSNATISSNTAGADGGGVALCNDSNTFTAIDTTIASNTATGNGGGVYVGSGTFNANSVVISGNGAGTGGGIYWTSYGLIRTSGSEWHTKEDKENPFSVDASGAIHDPPLTADPVQVYENTANTGKEMKGH